MLVELGKWTIAIHPLHWKFGENTSTIFHTFIRYYGPVWIAYG